MVRGLLLAVILAPTDAALGQAVVTLMRLPSRIRQGLNVESGLDDGICVPLFWIVLAIAQAESGAIGEGAAAGVVPRADRLRHPGRGACGHRRRLGCRGRRRARARRWSLAPGRAGGRRRARLRSGRSDRRLGLHRSVRRRFRVRSDPATSGGEVGHLIEELGEVFNGVTFIVFGRDLRTSARRRDLVSRALRRPQPDGYPDDSCRDCQIGTVGRRPTLAFLGWFGPPRASVNRLRGTRTRGGRPAARWSDSRHDLHCDWIVGFCSRSHRLASGQPLRRLVRVASP